MFGEQQIKMLTLIGKTLLDGLLMVFIWTFHKISLVTILMDKVLVFVSGFTDITTGMDLFFRTAASFLLMVLMAVRVWRGIKKDPDNKKKE